MNKKTYESVVHTMRLPDKTLFPLPITLDISEQKVRAGLRSESDACDSSFAHLRRAANPVLR